MKDALAVGAVIVAITAFVFAAIFAAFGTAIVYKNLFPTHGHTVCLVSHDEEHGGNTFTLCDKRVPQ